MRRFFLASLLLATAAAAAPVNVSLTAMDKTVPPGRDFFNYANGGWLKGASIPADRSYAGVNLELDLQNEDRLKAIVTGLAKTPDARLDADGRKLRDLYNGFMDTKAIEAAGLKPAAADLARIAAARTPEDIARLMGDPALGLDGPFGFYIYADQKHPKEYSVHLGQSGLGMPDRDYYLKDDKALAAARAAYKVWLAKALTLAGVADAQKMAAAVYDAEVKLAQGSWPAADRRDEDKTYNPETLADLQRTAPFPWAAMFTASGISGMGPHGARKFVVSENTAFPKLAKAFATTPVAVWRAYLVTRYLHNFADVLPKAVDDANFAFFGVVLSGTSQQQPRDKRALKMLDGAMGEALGRVYVQRHFPPEAKRKIDLLVANLLKAYAEDIKTLSWMTPATRAKALIKLNHITRKIGYPDKWRDYSALQIPKSNPLQAQKNATAFEAHRQLVRLDLPVDRGEWLMTPQTNNAYYEPTQNEIVFPAGILQPPYFDPKADDAVNYGEIGATIGHEISHGFDDQGSKYDADGTLRNWWTGTDRKNFDKRTAALAKQYDAYQPLPGLHINGKLTLGENIGDLSGLEIALKAYHLALGGKPAPVLDGMTGDQRFYIAYGQSWRELWRDARTRKAVLSNPHSPSKFRVNGVVRNSDGWYAAFPAIKSGDTYWLAPEQRIRLW